MDIQTENIQIKTQLYSVNKTPEYHWNDDV